MSEFCSFHQKTAERYGSKRRDFGRTTGPNETGVLKIKAAYAIVSAEHVRT